MMKRGKKHYESIYVPTRTGGLVQRACGTAEPALVRGMKRMVRELRDRARVTGDWTLLEAIRTRRAKLLRVYEAYAANQLAALEAALSAKNLSEHLAAWIAWVRANRQDGVRTADVYWQQVTTLIPEEGTFLATDLTKARVVQWLTSRAHASSGTRRKYLYALKSFIGYCVDAGVLATDPVAGLKAPKKNRARERWEPVDVDQRLVAAASLQYRAAFAFIHATGCDVGSAWRAQKGDVDLTNARTKIRGTKTDRRAVHQATIEAWALPLLEAHLKSVVGRHTLLFPTRTNSGASHHHARCCAAIGVEDYTLKDARHSVAVRMRLRGETFEAIAQQLGTSVFQVVQVYSKYQPEDVRAAEKKA